MYFTTVWVLKKCTPKKLQIIKKKSSTNIKLFTSYGRVFYTKSFGCYFLCGVCSRLDEQEALFAKVQKSISAKVAYVMFE